jgi:hypothetical protein
MQQTQLLVFYWMEWANFVAWSVNTQQVCPVLLPYFKKREKSLQKMNVLCKQEEYILVYFYHILCFSLCSNKRICIVILVILCWKNKDLAWHTRNGCSWPRCYIEGTFSASSSLSWEYSKTSGGKCPCHCMWLKCKNFTVRFYKSTWGLLMIDTVNYLYSLYWYWFSMCRQ